MQTAVEWFIEQITKNNMLAIDAIPQANKMFEQQIKNAFNEGENNSVDYFNPENKIKESEQYYNETFKK